MEETIMKKFGPVKAEEELLGAVVNYCEKTFPLEKSAPVGDEGECGMKLLSKMRSFLRGTQKGQARLMGEQYVERIVPYAMSETPIGEIGLQDETALAFARYLAGPDALAKPNANNNGRPVVKLYEHQEKSFKILTSDDPAVRKQHLVVCSGTGSGKTESFLIPLIDAVVKERKEKGTAYKPGVRALILYPMNALVNDQLRRLKAIISEIDDEALRPTFGRYTGELKRESELDTNDESIDEMNIGEEGAKKILKTIQDGLNCGDVLDRATLKLKGLDERISQQYQTRKQWADAPADILVTNYAMLERLLLRPDARGLFSTEQDGESTWRFIALDEAHSYTGSQGTEIAWLIRRLLGRLRVPNNVRFLATSATLRSRREGESDEQLAAWIAEHFAARIFPAKASDFHIEPGRPYCPDEMLGEQGGGYLGRIFRPDEDGGSVLLDEKGIELFDRTAELLMKDKILGESIGNFKSLVEVDALPDTYKATEIDHIIRLLKFDLSKVDGAFDGWDLDTCEFPAVKVTNGMRSAVKWLMEQINVPGFWYRYLSDPLTKRKDIAEKILEQWKDANANEWSGAAFSAFYRAIGDMVDSSTPYCDNDNLVSELFKRVQAFEVTPTEKIKEVLAAFRAKCKEDKAEIKSEEAELVAEWSKKCGVVATAGDGLEKFLFKILGGRNDIAKAMETLSQKMISVDGLCNEIAVPKEELFALLQLAMMAKKPGMRSPVLDVRYHQMIRGAFDVGVYFGDGGIPSVNFYRSDENACGDNRPLFSLGVCRDCGQLFLIGYTANSDFSVPQVLVRNKSASFSDFHVFAWYQGRQDHADLLNNEQSKQDEGKEICYVNLNNGLVVDKTGYDALLEGDRAGYVQMYWHRRATSRSFVQICPNCGKNGSSIGSPEYGIITPYVASDIQFKTEVLEEFVKGAVPDVDPAVSHRPGKGRKVLTFADSRARAAEMPAKFDENYNRKFFDDRIHEIVKGKPEVNQSIKETREKIEKLKAAGLGEYITQDELRLISSAEIWNLDNIARALLVELRKNRLEDMLSVTQLDSTRRGTPLELEAAVKYRIIHALHDSSRTGLLRGERVTVESQYIREMAKDYFNNNLTMAGWGTGQREVFIEGMEPLLQKLFALIFVRTWMTVGQSGLDMVWQTAGGFSKCLCMNEPPPRPNGASSPDFELITVGKYKKTCKKFCSDKLNMELSDELCIAVLQTFFGFLIEPQQVGVDQNTGVFINDALLVPICLLGKGGVPQDGLTSYKALSIRFLIRDLVVKFWKEPTQGFKYTDAERIRVEEHTAQLSSRQGRLYQQGFSDGRINILSCSTTFEMGIDVGALTRVLMLNTPPATANYKQRAGRAGRRPGACAYIATIADSDTVSQAYFEKPLEIFDGNIDPPSIYIEKKSFWSRHFRAEAMHAFLCWWQQTNEPFEYDWNSFKAFYSGRGTKIKPQPPVCDAIPSWLTAQGGDYSPASVTEKCKALLCASGIPKERLDYFVANDLAFQLVGNPSPYEMVVQNYFKFQELSGPFMPTKSNDGQQLVEEDENIFRCCAKKRSENAHDADKQRDAISSFAKYNVIPKYGFPVDVISLKVRGEHEVELSYDLKIGLYSYAPGRIIYANKRKIQSSDWFESIEQREEVNNNVWLCPSCGAIEWRNNEANEKNCLACRKRMEIAKAVRPKEFIGNDVQRGQQVQQGQHQQIYSGNLRDAHIIPGLSLYVSEPDTRMMRFFNLGVIKRKNHGFEYGFDAKKLGERVILYHEVITDMTLWTLPPVDVLLHPVQNVSASEIEQRIKNAYRSAAYALKKAIITVLRLTERDIGVVVREGISSDVPMPNGYKWTAIFYDLAQGGGGAILPIIRPALGHEEKIKEIVDEAIRLCENEECCSEDSGGAHPEFVPVSRAEWINKSRDGAAENYREAHACKRCIIGFDNRFEEGLDRLDALAVLKRIKELPQNGSMVNLSNPVQSEPTQSQESLVQILDKLIAHPNRNATDADKQFIKNFRTAVGNLDLRAPSQGKEFTNGVVHVRALLSWDDAQISIFSSVKGLDVTAIKPVFDGWKFIVISDQIDIVDLINDLKEV